MTNNKLVTVTKDGAVIIAKGKVLRDATTFVEVAEYDNERKRFKDYGGMVPQKCSKHKNNKPNKLKWQL